MMNNWMFRVAILKEDTDAGVHLKFEHPTLAGVASGGWMEVRSPYIHLQSMLMVVGRLSA
jgi:hypothetical protein